MSEAESSYCFSLSTAFTFGTSNCGYEPLLRPLSVCLILAQDDELTQSKAVRYLVSGLWDGYQQDSIALEVSYVPIFENPVFGSMSSTWKCPNRVWSRMKTGNQSGSSGFPSPEFISGS